MVDRLFQPKRRAVALAAEKMRLWDEQNKSKQDMLYNKRVKVWLALNCIYLSYFTFCTSPHYHRSGYFQTVNRIRDRYHNVLAARIQHGYRKYKARKQAKAAPVSKIRRSSNLAKVKRVLLISSVCVGALLFFVTSINWFFNNHH